MKKLNILSKIFVVAVLALSINITTFAAEADNNSSNTYVASNVLLNDTLSARSYTSVLDYTNSNFRMEINDKAFKPSFSSNNTRIIVAAKNLDTSSVGTIRVDVYKKTGILNIKTKVISFECKADGSSHTSNSFAITKGSNYVVDITSSNSFKHVLAVNIVAQQ